MIPAGAVVLIRRIKNPVEIGGANPNGQCLYGFEVVDGKTDKDALRSFRNTEIEAVLGEYGFQRILPGLLH